MRILLGVTGSIAAYKAAEIASALTKDGHEVDVILTAAAQKFVTSLTFSSLTHRRVVTDLWEEDPAAGTTHIELADEAQLVLIAPATANLIAQMALGLASDALTSTLLATLAPIVVAPAMNGKMWSHPATQTNVTTLKERGVEFIGPEEGLLACGYQGLGRLWPVDGILKEISAKMKKLDTETSAL